MDNSSSNHDTSSHAQQALVSERCQQFESALRDGHRPPIEGFLAETSGPDREQLVVALVAVEVRFRQDAGEHPELSEYIERFPEHESALLAAITPLLSSDCKLSNSTVVGGLLVSSELLTASHQAPMPSLGRYHLREIIGRGGFGEVWKGHDPFLDRPVAVKTIRSDRELSVSAVHGFISEGRHLARLKHPAIVSVYDVGVEHGRAFIVSELIDGSTLQSQIGNQPIPWRRAAALIEQIADALHVAHQANIFHRDIKPSNILMDSQGRPHVADFGLAVTEEQQLLESASTLGTYAYMSPEQLRGDSHLIDGRADIYSLGVVLYQLLTGRVPFLAKSVDQYREQALVRPPRPVRSIVENVPEGIEQICMKCLRKNPEERYSTAGDLAEALRQLQRSEPESAVVGPSSTISATRSPRARFVVLAATSAVVVFAGGWMFFNNSPNGESDVGNRPRSGASIDSRSSLAEGEFQPALLQGEDVSWDIRDGGQSIRVTSLDECLVKLGELTDGNLDFSAEIEPVGSEHVGIFFGHQTYGEHAEFTRFQLAMIQNWDIWEARQFYLKMVYFKGKEPGSEIYFGNRNNTPDVGIPDSQDFRIRIEGGKLVDVRLDGVSFREFISNWDRDFPADADCLGAFGLYCFEGSATFSNLRINGRPATIVDLEAGRPD
jgi:serine/threonine protein kinase